MFAPMRKLVVESRGVCESTSPPRFKAGGCGRQEVGIRSFEPEKFSRKERSE